MRRSLAALTSLAILAGDADAQTPAADARPIRVAVARLTHGHVSRVWTLPGRHIEVVAIYEPDAAVVDKLSRQFGFDRRVVHADLARMLDVAKPEAVLAFGSIREHMEV